MSEMGFLPDWLDLREPVDHAARDPSLLARAAECVGAGKAVLDLGSGTGSTARAFKGTVPDDAWHFLDTDEKLLHVAARRHPGSQQIRFNLRNVDALPLDGAGLVTASALLDLMPISWIEGLAKRLYAAGLPLYAALNYNGHMSWTPSLPDDAKITSSFNIHQLRDKGIGRATGPHAASEAQRVFKEHGFDVVTGDSPWELGAGQAALHAELLLGIRNAAAEVGCETADIWLDDRRAILANSTASIGHTDLLAIPR
ncbi:methyltransferase domain-containing protein [Aestuariibius sp. 2305UL40-4]|uniref:methyltransferase domain-containing protein n=1 Tax=Aestuariibius violaceus TaxID=3234132 RepID=UPI00345E8CD2